MAKGRPKKAAAAVITAAAGDEAFTLTAATAPAAAPKARRGKPVVPFPFKLVLNQWLLGLFGVSKLEELAEHLRPEGLEGLDENKIHHYHHALTSQLFNLTWLSSELLLEYDQNIVRHTQRLNERRLRHGEEVIVWKYFQYLALLLRLSRH